MVSIYVSKKVKEDLDKFIRSSRESPHFGAKNKYPSPNKAIEFLLQVGLKFPLSSLERLVKQPFIEFKMRMSDKDFEKIEKSGELKKIISEKLEASEGENSNGD